MVEHVYNPETALYEQLEAATVEAASLRRKLEGMAEGQDHDRQVVRQQLGEIEQRIASLQRQLRG